ncbi:MAG: bifunctional ornithine acetyltransferase/N-acetylglutamate synthase [Candidatus Desulforudis sp.]|nr:bifunctional ornithine acetyltransferase/N-acetylglutamate synthase [Desulforudis sp.]
MTAPFDWLDDGGITAPKGFQASGLHAGLKRNHKDLALVFSEVPGAAAGVFTTNKVKGAPLLVSMPRVRAGLLQALIVNSGNANTCNGAAGLEDARAMGRLAAEALKIPENLVLVGSTGVIGRRLPLAEIAAGIPKAVAELSPAGGMDAAEAIMTTDTVPKQAALRFEPGNGEPPVTIGGIAKGSGMIHPDMATMLAFIVTDAQIEAPALQEALRVAVDRSFHMISVDGDTSTNDMVVVLANGRSGGAALDSDTERFDRFQEALTAVCARLARMIARDGEGATRLLEVRVQGARTERDARLAARAIISSSLVKTAVFGNDANWGRIICAAGYSGASFDPDRFDVYLGDLLVAKDGGGLEFDEEQAGRILARDPVVVTVDFREGGGATTAWGCDFSYDYVRINANYRT